MFPRTFKFMYLFLLFLFITLTNASDPYCKNGEKISYLDGFVCCDDDLKIDGLGGGITIYDCSDYKSAIWNGNKNCLFSDAPCVINDFTLYYTDISDNDINDLNIEAVSNTNSKYSLSFGYQNIVKQLILSGQCSIEINGNKITGGSSNTGSGRWYTSSEVRSAAISSAAIASSIVNILVAVVPGGKQFKTAATVFKNLVDFAAGTDSMFGGELSAEDIALKAIAELREELYTVIEDVFMQSWDCTVTYVDTMQKQFGEALVEAETLYVYESLYTQVDNDFMDYLGLSDEPECDPCTSLQIYEEMSPNSNCNSPLFLKMNTVAETLYSEWSKTGLNEKAQRLMITLIDSVMAQRIEIYSVYVLSALDAEIDEELNRLPCSSNFYSYNNELIKKYISNFNGAYNSILTDSKELSYTDISFEIDNLFNFGDKLCQWVYVTYAFGRDIVSDDPDSSEVNNADNIEAFCAVDKCDCELWKQLSINKGEYDNDDNDNLMHYFYERIDSQMTDYFMDNFNSYYDYTSIIRENVHDEFAQINEDSESDYRIIVFDENWDRDWYNSDCRPKTCGDSTSRKHWWENTYKDDYDLYRNKDFDNLKITDSDNVTSHIRVPFILSSDIEENVEHDDVIAYSDKMRDNDDYNRLEISEVIASTARDEIAYCNDNSNIVGGRYLIEYDSSTAYAYQSRIIGFEVLCNENYNYFKDYGLYNFNNRHTLVGYNGEFIPVGSSSDTTTIEWSSWRICPKKHKLEISFKPINEAHIKIECEKRCRDGADGAEKADWRKLWWIASDPYVEYKCVPLSDDIFKGNHIEINQVDKYIGVYDKNNKYTDEEANEFCLNNFGTTLASIHSDDDNNNAKDARIVTSTGTLVGGNDKDIEDTWIWRDGTTWDYEPSSDGDWEDNGNDQHCLQIFREPTNSWNDNECNQIWNQFICNRYVYTSNPTISPTEYPTLSPTSYTGYILVDQDLRYDSAQSYCENIYGTSLATIQNADENEIIYNMITESGYSESGVWIGCNDIDNEGTFIWEDGTGNGDPIDNIYTNWYPNNPDNGGTRDHNCCKMVTWTGTWDDDNCPESRWFVCNHPPKYIIIDIDLSYSDAESYCQTNYGTSLAIINNDYENTKIHNMVIESGYSSSGLWIGINDIVSEGVFLWIDGILNDYTNWDINEPYNQGRDDHNCGKMKTGNGKWDDDGCNERRWFICNVF